MMKEETISKVGTSDFKLSSRYSRRDYELQDKTRLLLVSQYTYTINIPSRYTMNKYFIP